MNTNPVVDLPPHEFIALMQLFISSERALSGRLSRTSTIHLDRAHSFATGSITLDEFKKKCGQPFTLEQLKELQLPALFIFTYLRAMDPCK